MISGRQDENVQPQAEEMKPWDAVIKRIDAAYAAIYSSFDLAFAEGSSKPANKEVIKRGLFRYVWGKLRDQAPQFNNLEKLDQYYRKLDDDFSLIVGDYLRLPQVKAMSTDADLVGPVSERKMQMLRDIIHLYHMLAKTRFMLQNLNQSYAPDKCADLAYSIQVQVQKNAEMLEIIDVDIYQRRSVDTIKQFNRSLIHVLQEKGYGEADIENLVKGPDTSNKAFLMLLGKINELPDAGELEGVASGKKYDNQAMRARKLAEYIATVQTVRQILREVCEDVLKASKTSVEALASDYDAMKQIKNKLKNSEELDSFFRQIFDLKNTEEQAPEEAMCMNLRSAARDAIAECGKQSQMEQFTRFAANGWGAAAESVRSNVLDVISLTRQVSVPYQESLAVYVQAINGIKEQEEIHKQASQLIAEWRIVNAQTLQIVQHCDELLGIMETRLASISQTGAQYAAGFFKRHWPKMVIGAGILAAPAAAGILSSVGLMATLMGAGAALGSAGGAAFGLLSDSKHPPVAERKPVVLPKGRTVGGVDADAIINGLFRVTELDAERLAKRKAAKQPAPPVDVRVAEAPMHDLSPVKQDSVKKDDKEKAETTTVESSTPQVVNPVPQDDVLVLPDDANASRLTGWLLKVPGVAGIQAVSNRTIDAVTSLPSTVASLPGTVTSLPSQFAGLFTRNQQTPPGQAAAAQKPGVSGDGDSQQKLKK